MLASIGAGFKLEAIAGTSWFRTKAAGNPAHITTAYRDSDYQQRLYDGWVARLPGYNFALPPGQSKHELGLAVDVDHTTADWLATHGNEYGWARPYGWTEWWHFEYVATNDQHRHNQGADMPIDIDDVNAFWNRKVSRGGAEIPAIQELADAKSEALRISAKADKILAALAKVSSPAPGAIDYARIIEGVADELDKREIKRLTDIRDA